MNNNFFKRLATIGVSEYILVFLLVLSIFGVWAVSSSNVNLKLSILPPPPPKITTILGDSRTRAILIIGSSTSNSAIRVYAFSDPIVVGTTADADGIFLAAFTADLLLPGVHQFTAVEVLANGQLTDMLPKIAIKVEDDYTIASVPGSDMPTVKIGNADAATSQLIHNIILNQKSAHTVSPATVPSKNTNTLHTRLIYLVLLLIIILETALLLLQRAERKWREHKSFFHLGRGFHHLPTANPPTGRTVNK
jgi:hypothetical protein